MSVLGLEMEISKEKFGIIGSSKDQRRQMIMRGKRTKRSRPSVVSSSSGHSGGSRGGDDNDGFFFSTPSPKTSDGNSAEDQDMANCLILLAQSGGDNINSVKLETEEIIKAEKLSSGRKFTETATTTTGKAGFYVYECKTCNRSFTSFQALGGHRASHKKPKTLIDEKKVVVPSNNEGQINEGERENVQFNKTGTSISLHKSSQHNNNNIIIIKPKVHECSICGSEFSSGQALGGHMRRHRSIPTTNNNNIIYENEKPRNILQLDLNLPAPEDDHRDSKFPFIFSAPALVGCHY